MLSFKGDCGRRIAQPYIYQPKSYERTLTIPSMASCSGHDDHLSFSPSWTPRESAKVTLVLANGMINTSRRTTSTNSWVRQKNCRRNEIIRLLLPGWAKSLSLQLFHSRIFSCFPGALETIERIIALLFHQYPQLAREPEAKHLSTSAELAFTKLPIDTSDLNTLLAV